MRWQKDDNDKFNDRRIDINGEHVQWSTKVAETLGRFLNFRQ